MLPEHTLYVADYIVHENYNYRETGLQYDIVLLELEEHVYLDVYTPACLPRHHQEFSGVRATVAGWGATSYNGNFSSVLLEVSVPTVTNTHCERKMNFRLHPGQICAGGEEGRDSCQVELERESLSELDIFSGRLWRPTDCEEHGPAARSHRSCQLRPEVRQQGPVRCVQQDILLQTVD